ncbi:MAG: mechanosensitive ion channel family protein [Solirubrobacterales bacterium]
MKPKIKKPKKRVPAPQMPRWMFETRTDAWREAGLAEEVTPADKGRAWPRLILFSILIAGTLLAFNHRHDIAPGYGTEGRIITAFLLFAFGWGFASALGRTITPSILKRMDPGTAGTVSFTIRLVTIILVAAIALHIAGVKTSTLAVGGAFTAILLGLAAQQTLGNVFAGVVLQSTRPFRVGERVRISSGPLGGDVEGTVSSLGLFYTTLLSGQNRMMVPNNVIINCIVVPISGADGIDVKARFDSHTSPAMVQDMLHHSITVPTRQPPAIWLEEVDRDEVVFRILATPLNPSDGAKLAEQVLAVTRGTFEFEHAGPKPEEEDKKAKEDVPHGHA